MNKEEKNKFDLLQAIGTFTDPQDEKGFVKMALRCGFSEQQALKAAEERGVDKPKQN